MEFIPSFRAGAAASVSADRFRKLAKNNRQIPILESAVLSVFFGFSAVRLASFYGPHAAA